MSESVGEAVADTGEADATDGVVIERSSIRRNVASMMSSQLVTWVIATAASLVIPRFLGPEILGEFRLAGSLWAIATVITALGTSQFLQLRIARQQRAGLALVGPVLVLRTLAFGGCALVVAAYTAVAADTTRFAVLVAMIGVGTLLGVWTDTISSAFLGLERMSTVALVGAVGKFLYTGLVIAILVAGVGVYGVAAVGIGVGILGLGYLAVDLRRITTIVYRGWRDQASHILRHSATFMGAGVALVTYQQVDLIVISRVAEKEDLGWYGAADTLFGSLLFPVTILLSAIFPTMGRLHEADPAELRALITRTFAVLTVLAVPIGLGTVLVAPEFAPLLYGEDFRETGTVLAVLGPVIVLTFGTILFGGTALATGRARLWVIVMFGSALATIPLDMVLVPWANDRFDNGAIGGALAYVVTEGIQFVIGISFIAPYLISRTVAWRTLRVLAAGGAMFAVGWPLRQAPLPVPIAVCGIVYAIGVIALRVLGDDERRLAGDLLARAGIRTPWAG